MRGDRVNSVTAGLMILAALILANPVSAQVTMDNSALDALRSPEPRKPARQRPAPRRAPAPKPPATAAAPAPSAPTPQPQPAAAAKPVKPAIPVAPPAIAALPSPVTVPLAHPLPPPKVSVADDALGGVTAIAGGLRVTFGAESADLNPVTVAALREYAHAQVDQSRAINIFAYATGRPEDPSTPRRLSLERALAARAVLMNEGIPSPRIYPRALGPTGGSADPDRVDVTTSTQPPGGAG